jgi:hypothetical protein
MTGRKTGGRKSGTANKATGKIRELVEVEAGAPLPVLLTRIGVKAMNEGDHQLAVNALSRAASYVYARPQPDTEEEAIKIIQPLVVIDGVARVPDDWPGPAVHIKRTILNGPKDRIP